MRRAVRSTHSGLLSLAALALAACGMPDEPAESLAATRNDPALQTNGLGAFAHVTVGVANLDEVLGLWRDVFGLEVVATRDGPDASLGGLWNLAPDRIARQALLRTPGLDTGAVHFIEFRDPDPPVRAGAEVFDRVPKNLDIYTADLPAKYDDLLARGFEFRSHWAEMPGPGGITFREVQMPGHDDTNIVLLELVGQEYPFSPTGYAGIGPLITVVADADTENRFYTQVLGLEELMQFALAGPETEKMIGLPPGAALVFHVLGAESDPMGRIELVEYQRTQGTDRYALAKPPATGTLHVTWQVDDLAGLRTRLARHGVAVTEHGDIDAIFGAGPLISFNSPGGLRIEVQERRNQFPPNR
ncbi:MAG: VOC family protein [Gammaproteobacteria bacterium]|nr:VOC family protein [Gammaproteobacteria bacterium]